MGLHLHLNKALSQRQSIQVNASPFKSTPVHSIQRQSIKPTPVHSSQRQSIQVNASPFKSTFLFQSIQVNVSPFKSTLAYSSQI